MSQRYFIENGQTVSPVMNLDSCSAIVSFLFYDAGGLPVAVTGAPSVSRSLYETGNIFQTVNPFSTNEWRFNGPAARVKIDLAGVTGFATYRVLIWRLNEPIQMIPDGAFSGLRGIITQPYTEANVKSGLQYNLRATWPLTDTIASGTTRKIWFKTNAKPVIIKLREVQYVAEELTLRLFRAPTGVTGGTALSIHNYNSVLPVATTCQATKNVTTTSDGVEFDNNNAEVFFGASNAPQRAVSIALQGRERILPANTEFIVSITNSGAGSARAQYFLDWYEGGTDLPIRMQ